jgi:endo-1,4-beta-xylanase
MKNRLLKNTGLAAAAALILLASACKKDTTYGVNSTGNFTDTTGSLKSLASFPIGFALTYNLASTNSTYMGIAKREGAAITFGNELKNSSVLQNDGSFNFTTADAFYNLATNNGLAVYGHCLVWHSQQNTNFLNTITGASISAPNLIGNPGFETVGSGKPWANWSVLNNSNGTFSDGGAAAAHAGAHCIQAVCVAGGNNYNTQILSDTWPTTIGKNYIISYWIKGASAGSIQFEVRNADGSVSYQGGKAVTTGWTQVSYNYQASTATMALAFDLGGNANTFYIDDITVYDAALATPPTGPALVAAVDAEMKTCIQTVVGHYAGKIKQWDVLNEPFSDAGALRDNTNTAAGNGIFVWQAYLGINYATNAFNYAHAADPNADLFMNEYNLEAVPAKLTAFVNLANSLKGAGVPITGVGTQMHIGLGTSRAGIDAAFKALAGTGLKVRISELDVRLNSTSSGSYVADPISLAYQAEMYHYVVTSYFQNVPAAQRAGITVWGVSDSDSWLNTVAVPDVPLLFDKNYAKKPAYSGLKQALQGL